MSSSFEDKLMDVLAQAAKTRHERARKLVTLALEAAAEKEAFEAAIDVGDDAGLCDAAIWTAEALELPGIRFHFDGAKNVVYAAHGIADASWEQQQQGRCVIF